LVSIRNNNGVRIERKVSDMGYFPCWQCEHHYKDENGTEHCKVVDEHKSLNENCPECKMEREQAWLDREDE
jgi:rubredoxin